MNIHKLHIIGVNRDAVASQKGYSYQQLKTLEDWLENRVRNGNDQSNSFLKYAITVVNSSSG